LNLLSGGMRRLPASCLTRPPAISAGVYRISSARRRLSP